MTSILVAYEVTNALHLAINWIVIGAATALVVSTRDALVPHRARASDTALSAASPRPSE
jgi:hypothetical protein